jgi:hypothetical protein
MMNHPKSDTNQGTYEKVATAITIKITKHPYNKVGVSTNHDNQKQYEQNVKTTIGMSSSSPF